MAFQRVKQYYFLLSFLDSYLLLFFFTFLPTYKHGRFVTKILAKLYTTCIHLLALFWHHQTLIPNIAKIKSNKRRNRVKQLRTRTLWPLPHLCLSRWHYLLINIYKFTDLYVRAMGKHNMCYDLVPRWNYLLITSYKCTDLYVRAKGNLTWVMRGREATES